MGCLYLFAVQPEIDKSKELGKAASKTGVTGRLTCRAEGAPSVRFEWRKVSIDKAEIWRNSDNNCYEPGVTR